MKESAHQGKPEERSRRLGDNGVIGTGKDVIVTGELPFVILASQKYIRPRS